MKRARYIELTVMLLMPLGSVWPQMIHPYSASFGVASTNMTATLDDGKNVSSGTRLSVAGGGLFVDLWPSDHFSFVTGIEYQSRGTGQVIPFYNSWLLKNDSLTLTYKYVCVPLLVRYRYPTTSLIPYVLGGLGINMNLETNSGKSLVLDATIGAGVRTEDILPIPIFIEGRYSFDFTSAFETGITIGLESIKSSSLSIAIGFAF